MNKLFTSFTLFFCVSVLSFGNVYAGRTGLTRREQRQSSRVVINHERLMQSPHKSASHMSMHSTPRTNKYLALMLVMGLMLQPTQAGVLDGRLSPVADKAGRFVQNYHTYADSHPVKAKMAVAGSMIAAKATLGAIAAGVPTFGAGAPAGFTYGAIKGIADEAKGLAIGGAIHAVAGDRVEMLMEKGVQTVAPVLMALDNTLNEQQAAVLGKFVASVALSSAEFTSLIKGVHVNDIAGARIDMGSVGRVTSEIRGVTTSNFAGEVRKNLHLVDGVAEGLGHVVHDAFLGRQQNAFHAESFGASLSAGNAFQQASSFRFEPQPQQQPISLYSTVMAQASDHFRHEGYLAWKAQSSSLGIPAVEPFGGHFNKYGGSPGFDPPSGIEYSELDRRMRDKNSGPGRLSGYLPQVGLEDCVAYAEYIYDNTEYINQVIAYAKSLEPIVGEINFPAVPDVMHKCSSYLASMSRKVATAANNRVIQEYKTFLDTFNEKGDELNRRIDEYNQKISMASRVREIIDTVRPLIKDIQNPRDYIMNALAVFSKKSVEEYLLQPYDDIRSAFGSLEYVNMMHEIIKDATEDSRDTGERIDFQKLERNLLGLFKSNARSIAVVRSILMELSFGEFDTAVKSQARSVVKLLNNDEMLPPQLATSVTNILKQVVKTSGDYIYVSTRLSELANGFLNEALTDVAPDQFVGEKAVNSEIICTPRGVCGLVNEWMATMGTRSDLEVAHAWFVDGDYSLDTAQSLLHFIKPKGKLVGNPYICAVHEEELEACAAEPTANIRSLDGGHKEALKIFQFLAGDNVIRDGHDMLTDVKYKRVVLSDKTKITLYTRPESGQEVIMISDIPHWMSEEDIELRFVENEKTFEFAELLEKLNVEIKRLQNELYEDFDALPEEEKRELLDYYEEVATF